MNEIKRRNLTAGINLQFARADSVFLKLSENFAESRFLLWTSKIGQYYTHSSYFSITYETTTSSTPGSLQIKTVLGNPRDSLNVLRLLAGCPSGLRIRFFKSLSRLEFRVLRKSKSGFAKFRELQNGTFSGTIPSVGPPESIQKLTNSKVGR